MSPDFNYCTILPKMHFIFSSFFCCFFLNLKMILLTKSFSRGGGRVARISDRPVGYKSLVERVYCIEFGLHGRAYPSYTHRFRLD